MTSFQLPVYQGSAQGWALSDYKPDVILTSGLAGQDGIAVATGPQVDQGTMWAIQHAVCSSTSSSDTSLRLYDSASVSVSALLSVSNSGNFDEAEWPSGPGLLLPQSRQLVAVWSGCSTGAVGTIRLQVALMTWAGS